MTPPIPTSIHKPLVIFSLPYPSEEDSDRADLVGSWCLARINPPQLPSRALFPEAFCPGLACSERRQQGSARGMPCTRQFRQGGIINEQLIKILACGRPRSRCYLTPRELPETLRRHLPAQAAGPARHRGDFTGKGSAPPPTIAELSYP